MIDVLLGQSYYLRFDPKLWDARQPYAPLGTLYAAARLRALGYDVRLFDAMLAASEAGWAAALDQWQPRLAVIYEDSFNYLSKMCLGRMREAALNMIDMARERGCPVVVSGSDATDHPDLYLARGAVAVISGEGEITLGELADALTGRSRAPLERIDGLVVLDAQGTAVRTPPRAFVRDLDTLPFPAWDLVNIDEYRRIWRARHGYYSMNLTTTRGCPYSCNWCARPVYGQRYSVRSPEAVVEEMAWLVRAYDPDHFAFADDIFGLKPGWIARFGDLVTDAGLARPFKCLLRVDLVDDAVVAGLVKARCRTVWVGAESGSQRVLDAMQKGTRVEQIERTTRLLKAAGVEVGFFLQFGYPGETWHDVQLTLAMIRRCGPDDIGISVSYPLPGTPFYERVRAELQRKQNWDDSADLAMMYRGPYATAFYRALHQLTHTEFRMRRAWSEVATGLASPAAVRPRHVRRAVAAAYHAARLPWMRAGLRRLERRERLAPTATEEPPVDDRQCDTVSFNRRSAIEHRP